MSKSILQLQSGIIYGPVNSRRLGSSLGINLLPIRYKACPFNCAYCQYGFTGPNGYTADSDGHDMPTVNEVIGALEEALDEYPSVSYITFSGNGEPTLHPEFGAIVDKIMGVRNHLAPQARLAILSNSALVDREEVRVSLSRLDARFMKLDAGDEETFRRFNRAHQNIKYDDILSGLKKLKNITIQALFAGGECGNFSDRSIASWIEKIIEIRPNECHIYSIERPAANNRLTLIDESGLREIKERAESLSGIPVKIFRVK